MMYTGIGNVMANIKHGPGDGDKKKKRHQYTLEKKHQIGALTRYKIVGRMDENKAKWKIVKEEDWQEHVTKDEVK